MQSVHGNNSKVQSTQKTMRTMAWDMSDGWFFISTVPLYSDNTVVVVRAD